MAIRFTANKVRFFINTGFKRFPPRQCKADFESERDRLELNPPHKHIPAQ